MYYYENDTPAMARTSNLNEELGQVSKITHMHGHTVYSFLKLATGIIWLIAKLYSIIF